MFLFRQNQHGNWAWNLIQIDFQDKISASEFIPYNRSAGKGKSTKVCLHEATEKPKTKLMSYKVFFKLKANIYIKPFSFLNNKEEKGRKKSYQ